jgi:uncharacterized protein (TIGR02246 family)
VAAMENEVERELVDLEKQYWQAMVDGDVEAALRLTDDPCIVTGSQGVAKIDHDKFATMMQSDQWTLKSFALEDEQVRFLSDDVAIIAYKVKEELTVDGKPLTLEASDASTWVRRDGRWVCALHTESITGDPFGRDRKPAAKPKTKKSK